MASKIAAFADAGPEVEQTSSAPVISVQNLIHRYENRTALNGISFDVRPAELFGLLGPNGSGKTTLFRILSTLMIPTAGRALMMGQDAAQDPSSVRRQIGVVFQAQSVDPELTAYENLWHQGHLYGLRGATLKKRSDGNTRSRWLGRPRQRTASKLFPVGCSGESNWQRDCSTILEYCLLDEPTTGLDPGARRDLWQYLQRLRDEEHVSVLVTTHLMEEAERCDRLAILNEGNLVALGTPAELKSEIGGDVIILEATQGRGFAGGANARALPGRDHGSGKSGADRTREWTPIRDRCGRSFPGRNRGYLGEQTGARGCVHSPHWAQVLERDRRSDVRFRKSTRKKSVLK